MSCPVCEHPQRLAIEKALRATPSLRVVTLRWGIHHLVLYRHRRSHMFPVEVVADDKPIAAVDAPMTISSKAAQPSTYDESWGEGYRQDYAERQFRHGWQAMNAQRRYKNLPWIQDQVRALLEEEEMGFP